MIKRFVLTLITITTIFVSNVYAEDQQVIVDWGNKNDPITIFVNEDEVSIPSYEPTPFIDENGRTQVPIRFVSEALGCKVTWDSTTKSVLITKADGKYLKLYIGKSEALKEGEKIYFDTVPRIEKGRTFVPARFISENLFDATVNYDASTKIVSITMDKELLIYPDFKKVREVLGKEKITIDDEILLYSNEILPNSKNCSLYISKSIHEDDKFDLIIGIRNYDTKTLEAAKLVLKVFYPTGFEEAYNKLQETVKGSIVVDKKTFEYQGIKNLYYDNRYYGSTKFEDATCVYVGKVGVKY